MPSGPPVRDQPPPPPPPPAFAPPVPSYGPPSAPPVGAWQPVGGEPPPRRSRWVTALAALVVVAVVAGLAAFVAVSEPDDNEEASDVGIQDDAGSPDDSEVLTEADFDGVIDDLIAFVENERGLTFATRPVVTFQDDAEFEAGLRVLLEEDLTQEDLDLQLAYFQALGLVEPDADMRAIFDQLYSGAVLGYYSTDSKELYVRGGNPTAYARQTLAHELVHALEDEHFGIDRPELDDTGDERGLGLLGLTEGSAEYIGQRYEASLSDKERRALLDEEASFGADLDIRGIPLFLFDNLTAPYAEGPELIDAILAGGGQPALDAAFDAPPITSEQFLEPTAYLSGDGPLEVPPPAADGTEIERGAYGALFWRSLLFAETAPAVAARAVEGWGGDDGVLYDDGDRKCVRVNLVGDTDRDTDELLAALDERGAAGADEFSVELVDGIVTFTSCG